MTGVSWDAWLVTREKRRRWAVSAAAQLCHTGEVVPLPGWRLTALPLDRERLGACRPSEAALSVSLTPSEELAVGGSKGVARPFVHRMRLEARHAGTLPSTEPRRIAWALERLAFLGERVEESERSAWSRDVVVAPEQDAGAAAVWAGWIAGASWDLRPRIEALYLPAAERAFRAVFAARRIPGESRQRALADLREAFFYRFLIPGADGLPGWVALAARTLESADQGPMSPLLALLDEEGRRLAAMCVSSRRGWRDTVAAVCGGRTDLERAARIAPRLDGPEGLADIHVVRCLLRAWREGRTGADWAVVTQARGRLRARLRGLAALRPAALGDAVMALDGLHHRTVGAVKRYSWAWAWDELATDFAFDLERRASPGCDLDLAVVPGLDPADQTALRSWVLLVVLKGRLGHLQTWVDRGATGDRDTTWGRLLAQELPFERSDYPRVRVDLMDRLPELLRALHPMLRTLSGLPQGRRLRAEFSACLESEWDPRVPFPRSGFPTFRSHAAAAVDALAAEEL